MKNKKLQEEIKSLKIESLQEEIEILRLELSETRHSHVKLCRGIKKFLGYKNWPKINGVFVDGIIDLLLKSKN